MSNFRKQLATLLNCHSKENNSQTPDFLLAEYLVNCLDNFDEIMQKRRRWYREEETPIADSLPLDNPS